MKTNINLLPKESFIKKKISGMNLSYAFRAWSIWICAGAFYFYEMVLRVSPSTMTEELMRTFSVSSTTLGILSSCYYYAYSALQIPCGFIIDWLGARKVITLSAFLCAIGSYLFAQADSLILAQLGRFLIGAGSACAFLSCLKIASQWFHHSKFALICGLTNMLGTLGGTFAGSLFAETVETYGWRNAMSFAAYAGIGMIICSWLVIRDKSSKHPNFHEEIEKSQIFLGLKAISKNPQFWLIAWVGCLMYLPISAFTELWAVPYLVQRFGIEMDQASSANIMLFIGVGIGSPLVVWISDYFRSRIKVMSWCALIAFLLFLIIIWIPGFSLTTIYILLFTVGFFTSAQILSFSSIKESVPNALSGTAIGFTNTIVTFSAIIFQPLMGKILDILWEWHGQRKMDEMPLYTIENYKIAIMAVPICLLCSWGLLRFIRDTYPKTKHKA